VFCCSYSHQQAPAVKCSLKANDGYLYPMDRCFIFIHKPPTYIRYSDVTVVEFARVSSEKKGDIQGGSRTFDLVVYTKGGNDVQFTGMQRYERLLPRTCAVNAYSLTPMS
jgi:structure-specific recognition protein 1